MSLNHNYIIECICPPVVNELVLVVRLKLQMREEEVQVTGEPRSSFQGQCCNLQVKRRNSTPVCGTVTWFPQISSRCWQFSLSVLMRMLQICISASVRTHTTSRCLRRSWGLLWLKPKRLRQTQCSEVQTVCHSGQSEPRLTSPESRRGSSRAAGTATGNTGGALQDKKPSSQIHIRLPLRRPECSVYYCVI